MALNREIQAATHQLLQKLPLAGHQFQHAAPAAAPQTQTGTLFLQLTVEDLGICLPMNQVCSILSLSADMIFLLVAENMLSIMAHF